MKTIDDFLSLIYAFDLKTLLMILIISLIVITIMTVLNALVLADCASKEPKEWEHKNKWIIMIAVLPLGWLAYILFRRPKRISQFGR